MASEHYVSEGECITSIADATGHYWQTIWDDPANAELRRHRSNPHTLSPGDRLIIPDLRERVEREPTGKRYRFRRKGIPARFTLQLFRAGHPRAEQPWDLGGDGFHDSGVTDSKGVLSTFIPTTLMHAVLCVGPDDFRLKVRFGSLPPIEEVEGWQARLTNLGFYKGSEDGTVSEALRDGLRRFQSSCGLPETGEADEATRAKMVEIHDVSKPERIQSPKGVPAVAGGEL